MKKLLRNKNFLIIAAAVALIAAVLIAGLQIKPSINAPLVEGDTDHVSVTLSTQSPEAAFTPVPEKNAQEPTLEEAASPAEAKSAGGYVIVTAGNESRIYSVPTEGEYSFSVVLQQENGEETENVVHISSEGVYMEKSTCENQDCVNQGLVTLENRDTRVLYNMIVCLPNQVMLELYTYDEIMEMLGQTGNQTAE